MASADDAQPGSALALLLHAAASKVNEIEAQRNDLEKKVRGHKTELASIREEAMKSQSLMQEEFSSKMASYERIEIEFASYKKTVSVKLAQFE